MPMDPKKEQNLTAEAQKYLTQISLELEASATGAREAARLLPDRKAAWGPVQKMYTRLLEANHLLDKFRSMIDDTIKFE